MCVPRMQAVVATREQWLVPPRSGPSTPIVDRRSAFLNRDQSSDGVALDARFCFPSRPPRGYLIAARRVCFRFDKAHKSTCFGPGATLDAISSFFHLAIYVAVVLWVGSTGGGAWRSR